MADFATPPAGVKLNLKPFKAHVDEQKLQDMKQLLKLSPIAPAVYENSHPSVDRRYGVSRSWMTKAKDFWLNEFDWRKHEDHINSFPQFTTTVKDDLGNNLEIHFMALFSKKTDAIPIAFFHGWPGSFCEFLDIAEILRSRHSPQDLPYHVIVPSLPGYAYSGGPPLDSDYGMENASEAMNNLMIGLGFESGYLAQGGDLGYFVSQHLAVNSASCKGMHVNFAPLPKPSNADELQVSKLEADALPRGAWFRDQGTGYSLEHGTRTATIGFALSASPLALLSWIGEKFLEWSDEDPPLDKILEDVTLYWLTDTFPRCIYPYRGSSGTDERPRIASASGGGRVRQPVSKPSGYSFFPKELIPMPASWVGTMYNLVSTSTHSTGGHFAAIEKPNELLKDVEEWIAKAWNAGK